MNRKYKSSTPFSQVIIAVIALLGTLAFLWAINTVDDQDYAKDLQTVEPQSGAVENHDQLKFPEGDRAPQTDKVPST